MMQDKPVLLMKKVINLFFRELDAMNTEKLQEPISGHNMIVIEYLTKHEEPVYQRDLENHFFVRRSTVSKVLRWMEEKGMIERLSVHDDARLKQIMDAESMEQPSIMRICWKKSCIAISQKKKWIHCCFF